MLKIGDKVKILNIWSPIEVYSTDIGDIVEVINISSGEIYYKNNNGNTQRITPEQVEFVYRMDGSNFKIGDKVRLNTDEETSDYYSITKSMIENYDVLTIRDIAYGSYSGDGGYLIKVQENTFNYYSDWLELVEDEQEEMMANVEEEIGYTTITAVHFGNYGEYTWQCDRELFEDINLLDLVLVDTVKGEQVVQVVKKSETLDVKDIHKEVIKKVNIY